MKRLPLALIDTKKLGDTQIIPYAKAFIAGLVAETVTFPTPPYDDTALTALVNSYITAAAAAIKGPQVNTFAKADAKKALLQAMKADVTYINQVVTKTFQTTPSTNLDVLRALILSVGLKATKIPGRPNTNGQSRVATVLANVAKNKGKSGANVNGVMYIRVTATAKYGSQAIKTFWLQFRTPAVGTTPAGPWRDYISTTSRIKCVQDMAGNTIDAGVYEYQVAPIIGVFQGKTGLNWSNIARVIVT